MTLKGWRVVKPQHNKKTEEFRIASREILPPGYNITIPSNFA